MQLTPAQLNILDFWHKIEFFLPFDLQKELIDNEDIRKICYSEEQLSQISTEELWKISNLDPHEEPSSYTLFLGIYDKNDLDYELARILEPEKEQDERYEMKSCLSCCAKIKLTAEGTFDLAHIQVELSTTPWAIGKIKQANKGVEGKPKHLGLLSFEYFERDLEQLKAEVAKLAVERQVKSQDDDTIKQLPLSGKELIKLLHIVYQWVGFETLKKTAPAIYIQQNTAKKKKAHQGKENADKKSEQSTDITEPEIEISIINSFYAKDIADTMRLGRASRPLFSYLKPVEHHKRIDLYQPIGKSKILEHLMPHQFNKGRWFENSKYSMSLMQQFAINSIFKVKDQAVFSVNGPPGTGKTTLLKEVFAENIIQRALVLSQYQKVEQTFKKEKVKVTFNQRTLHLSELQDNLKGFEMVVSSSNNAAVQNISEELPQTKSLAKSEWRDENGQPKVRYLQTIAQNIVAFKQGKEKAIYQEIEQDKLPWGLISCVLGNSKNRKAFINQFMNADKKAEGFDESKYQGIMQWKDNENIPSFAQAKEQFKQKYQAVENYLNELNQYAEAMREDQSHTLENRLQNAQMGLEAGYQKQQIQHTKVQELSEELNLCNKWLENFAEEKRLIKQNRPNFLQRLFQKQQSENDDKLRDLVAQEKCYLEQKASLKKQLKQATDEQSDIFNNIRTQEQMLAEYQLELEQHKEKRKYLADRFKSISFTFDKEELDLDDWQIKSLWHSEALNLLRSELFQVALQLHEAWLKEAFQIKKMSHNIFALSNLLSNSQYLIGSPEEKERNALIIWQTLFMIVPIVSTTFASFRSLFRHLRSESLGWLFVDEAGQAIPQAAVGALWRAKRAVIVGDPLQIEPVFTTPIDFTERLASVSNLPECINARPHQTSVQILADQANPFGAMIGDLWIGSPLRVHRRCVEPMFSIANEIAYEGKMVYGNGNNKAPPHDSIALGESAWIDITPNSEKNLSQIQREMNFIKIVLKRLTRKLNAEPPIYIITPFRKIKEQLQKEVKDLFKKEFADSGINGRAWAENNIGTVHTFQGKENQIVFLVLGRDEENINSASLLVSKPNLINVAATRAKHRFFIVGNHQLWTNKYPLLAQTSELFNTSVIQGEAFLNNFYVEEAQPIKIS